MPVVEPMPFDRAVNVPAKFGLKSIEFIRLLDVRKPREPTDTIKKKPMSIGLQPPNPAASIKVPSNMAAGMQIAINYGFLKLRWDQTMNL